LREAIESANATADNDTVEFNASLSGQTITLSGTQLTIANNGTLTIHGLGATQLAVSGNTASRVFFVNNGATAAISGLTITAARFIGGYGRRQHADLRPGDRLIQLCLENGQSVERNVRDICSALS
jgi:hypothetical protein